MEISSPPFCCGLLLLSFYELLLLLRRVGQVCALQEQKKDSEKSDTSGAEVSVLDSDILVRMPFCPIQTDRQANKGR